MEGSEPFEFRNLHVSNLSDNTTEQLMASYFSRWGDVVNTVVRIHSPTGRSEQIESFLPRLSNLVMTSFYRSRNFGFVTFTRKAMADSCLSHKKHVLDRNVLTITLAVRDFFLTFFVQKNIDFECYIYT